MKTSNILIVGAGGIGSWLCYYLYNLQNHRQIPSDTYVTVADPDTVEDKNLTYQKFEEIDITDNKALTMESKYGFSGLDTAITSKEHLKEYDLIISCVDNTSFRKLMFTECHANGKYFIDLRSEGTTIFALTKHSKNDLKYLLSTLPDDIEDTSCQRPFELQGGIIQQGNKIIAGIGSQFVLNYIREDKNPPRYTASF